MEKLPKVGLPILIGVILLIIVLAKSAVTLDSGHAGVLYETLNGGVVADKDPLGPGFHIIAPWNRVIDYETRQQEMPEKMSVLSSNGLDIKLDASILYQPDYKNLGRLHNEKGENYVSRVLQPAIRSAARSVVGRYTPEQLYSSKRDAIQEEIFEETRKIVEPQFIQLNDILIRDVTLPPTIKQAIERKLKQEQESLEYEFRLVTAQKEAEKVIIEAQGKADANRILSASLTDKILQDKGIEATVKLSESPNSKVVVIGSGDSGMPIILGNQ
ncbi:prohibitin family protein [Winogradskyella sediminis]|uniref:Regulator of protease activity HflC, stomatin/prohibitin superfamily n=1 Tax=Winogradskyella sediminis TaxID=1382466 RepID=A0A1H1LNV3_9FLAO|nr:prohibitin family protein [Winogradskyella sediminis]REG86143.1 regulator of protease activity HflC (stomatin/prohibitin superfamily) [Winogradskyella sediminis]SDR75980.1 Regulator of protease activity HflC, stomatin/prohibitin superfamily [Winogradskyella sediminis]